MKQSGQWQSDNSHIDFGGPKGSGTPRLENFHGEKQ